MSSARMAPLWRSAGRCVALQRRPAAAAKMTPFSRTASTVPTRSRPSLLVVAAGRRAAFVPSTTASVRGYADDATTTRSDGSSTENSTQADLAKAAAPLLETQPSAGIKTPASSIPTAVQDEALGESSPENHDALQQLELLSQGLAPFSTETDGHKFGLTTATTRAATVGGDESAVSAFPLTRKLQERYDPVTQQLTRLMMRDGKLAKAQRDMALVLNYLRTSPPPKLNPARPLQRGHAPAAQLPLDPVAYLALVVDSVAPLIKVKSLAGGAGGGRALPVPIPLAARQRRRTAFMWLLDVVANRQSRGSGKATFAHRVAEEVVAVAEGRSSLWDKRQMLHKQGTTARMNVAAMTKRKSR